jgi:hypothetical protein
VTTEFPEYVVEDPFLSGAEVANMQSGSVDEGESPAVRAHRDAMAVGETLRLPAGQIDPVDRAAGWRADAVVQGAPIMG